MGFTTFGLSDHIMKGIGAAGYTVPTPIQILAIEPAVAGRDIIACAQTGTGKTAAFVLPILHHLASGTGTHPGGKLPRALVLTPTRELCQQVQQAVAKYGKFLSLRSASIYGGAGMEQQIKALRRGADIIVATPGRLLDHMQRKTVDLSGIRILVLDEADRMLDMGFINDVRKIIAAIPSQRQTMLFSATISADIKTLASNILRDPQTVQVGERRNPAETIVQHFYNAPQGSKIDLLVHALEAEHMQSVLVFSRTKHGADKISRRLERTGIASATIHSNRIPEGECPGGVQGGEIPGSRGDRHRGAGDRCQRYLARNQLRHPPVPGRLHPSYRTDRESRRERGRHHIRLP